MQNDCWRTVIRGKVGDVAINQTLHWSVNGVQGGSPFTRGRRILSNVQLNVIPRLILGLPTNWNGCTIEARRVNNGGSPTQELTLVRSGFLLNGITNNVVINAGIIWAAPTPGGWRVGRMYYPGLWPANRPANGIPPMQAAAMQSLLLSLQLQHNVSGSTIIHVHWMRSQQTWYRPPPECYRVATKLRPMSGRRVWGKSLNWLIPYP